MMQIKRVDNGKTAKLQDGSTLIESWTLTFFFSHAEEKNDGTQDID